MAIKNHIPNSITSLNLLSGCVAVIFAFYGDFRAALVAIIAASLFDFLDGFSARLLKAYSPMGKELDSLADMISFGLAPALILFNKLLAIHGLNIQTLFEQWPSLPLTLSLIAVLLVAPFSALRLAKFNIDSRQSENFIGLATPSNALLTASAIAALELYESVDAAIAEFYYIYPVCALLLSYLLISEIPMFSFKFKSFKYKENRVRFIFLAVVLLLAVCTIALGLNWNVWVFAIFASYILINIVTPTRVL